MATVIRPVCWGRQLFWPVRWRQLGLRPSAGGAKYKILPRRAHCWPSPNRSEWTHPHIRGVWAFRSARFSTHLGEVGVHDTPKIFHLLNQSACPCHFARFFNRLTEMFVYGNLRDFRPTQLRYGAYVFMQSFSVPPIYASSKSNRLLVDPTQGGVKQFYPSDGDDWRTALPSHPPIFFSDPRKTPNIRQSWLEIIKYCISVILMNISNTRWVEPILNMD